MRLDIIIGTRPNFIKVTRFRDLASKFGMNVRIIHTGQHYDRSMADVFFEQFSMIPDYFLNVQPGSPVQQMAEIMQKLEVFYIDNDKPDVMIVPGDVNSTLAAALTANKLNITLAHLEAGLRSYDRTMPEEFNRILTDDVSDIFFVTEASGKKNLLQEGKPEHAIHFVGNTMIDTMVAFENKILESNIMSALNLSRKFVLITMHRPGNVDSPEGLQTLLQIMKNVATQFDIVFPIHPRTVQKMNDFGLKTGFDEVSGLKITDPMAYFDFQHLILHSAAIITDSGGIQEESTFRRVPCITLRQNTERPVTITEGTNRLMSFEVKSVSEALKQIDNGDWPKGSVPQYWDGNATERILEVLCKFAV